ncbi:hypothetical protein EX895_000585 [Sporisorium graminicola]|uniref:MIT domain-containing protein n=1 Tax=Sporisorium graminicola TaxID=280036 RepID=A0A4U7L1K8_9BASI|nr:hypothetical protein EX895_000585 [Sporisorium graminicola]TKY90587.1 hypothetical protein EX895_000585 [Sporisorium graminicola]
MAQVTSSSMPQGERETSFLSFDDVPNSPNPPQLNDTYAARSSLNKEGQHLDPASPERAPVPSGSNHTSPFKGSRLSRLRPSSAKDLAAAAFADASEASNRSESLHSSPPRAPAKQPSSRGSRLGALLGRSLPNNAANHTRTTSSSTNHTDGASSNDSGFFGRRNRSKPLTANEDIDEAEDAGANASSSSSAATLSTTYARPDAVRSASAMGMLDFKADPGRSDGNSLNSDFMTSNARPARPSSQSNLLESFAASSNRDSTLGPPTQQTRGGRLGRLAYKKDDSIAFIAQSRNASQRMAPNTRNSSLPESEHQQHHSNGSSQPLSYSATRGLGIEDVEPYSASSWSRHHEGAEHASGTETSVGIASTRAESRATATSSNTSSRAPSVAGTHAANYHNRFSRQLSQELAGDPSQASEPRATPSYPEASLAMAEVSRTSYERSTNSPRGTLSDAAIAALGAMPGASAGSLLNANGAPFSSKNILTIALQKAQNAVQLDSANNVPEAIAAYKQAVRLLEEVMERIAPRNGKRSRPSREEERRRLRVIHDTYADRIRLLSMIYSPDLDTNDESGETSFGSNQPRTSAKADWLDRVRDDSQEDPTPRMNDEYLDPNVLQRSPRDDSQSFLSMTPVGTVFQATSPQPAAETSRSSTSQHPFPKSPPMPNAPLSPLSPALNTSPRRRVREHARPSSRESRGSRVSMSLSIADEQEAQDYRLPPPVIAEETPRVSVEVSTPHAPEKTRLPSPAKQSLRDGVKQAREVDGLAQQHSRSDSDSSHRSSATASRLKPTSTLPLRTLGLEEEVRTPATPYFDALAEGRASQERASDGLSATDAKARQPKLSLTSTSTAKASSGPEASVAERTLERPAKMGLAQRARALSFKGPLLRQKASMPSLGDRKRDDASGANGASVPAVPLYRPVSAESAAVDPSLVSAAGTRTDHPTPWDMETSSNITVRPAVSRPRASTASALVSASTSAGTISQRRKTSQAGEKAVQGLSGELEELGWMEDSSRGSSSIGVMGRPRSTSQQGMRRPSIPAAFLSAIAGASGGVLSGSGTPNGEHLPPPVPDLARTLSALDLKKSSDAHGVGKTGGADTSLATAEGDLSISTLAMPLPRPALDEFSAEDSRYSVAAENTFLITDIFPSGLPSLAAGAPSYASTTLAATPLSSSLPAPPAHQLLRPFYVMEQLRLSIVSGAQVTERLYLSRSVWRQAGVKLASVDTKVRAIEALVGGLEAVERGGEALLMPLGSGGGLETSNASRFVRCLDEWEVLLVEVQASLSRKLAVVEGGLGRDGAGGVAKNKAFGGLGSRFTRGLDRMAAGVGQTKALDSVSISGYVEALQRLFKRSGVLATHLRWILAADGSIPASSVHAAQALTAHGAPLVSPTGVGTVFADRTAYYALPAALRAGLLQRLKKSSEFMGRIVLTFVMQDIGVLVERSVKKGSGFFE